MKYLQKHRGRLYYRRRVPAELLPAFDNQPVWRRALELSERASDAEIAAKWSQLHEDYENLEELARTSNTDVIEEAELRRKARAWLRQHRLEEGILNSTRTDTPEEQVREAAYWLAVGDAGALQRKTLLFSECYSEYVTAKGIDPETQREHKNVRSHWERFLAVSGDSSVTKSNIESAIDAFTEKRIAEGRTRGTIARELSTVCAILRRGIRKHRLDVTFTLPELPREKPKRRKSLPAPLQVETLERVIAGYVPTAEGLAILLGIEGGVILSETARLLKSSVHTDSPYPHLFIEGLAKTDARLRPIPLTVALSWTRTALRALHEAEPDCPYALGSRWNSITESARGAAVKRYLPDGYSSYSLRHAARANAIANCGGDANPNAALICGWTASGGLSEHMFSYAASALEEQQEALLGGLTETSRKLNAHLLGIGELSITESHRACVSTALGAN